MTASSTSPNSVPAIPGAPSITVPLRFVVTGLLALLAGVIWLVVRPDILATYHYNQYVLAVTHLFTLGWISSIIMGAMYQLVPVALETQLYDERLARWQHGLHTVGVAGMVWTFWTWDMRDLGHFGSLVGLGMLFFAYNMARTLARVRRWNVIASAIAAAISWLVLTMLAGLYLVASKCWGLSTFGAMAQMHAHAHLGGIGFFIMLMVGVSYKLAPMFLLSEIQSLRRARASILLLNIGLVGLFITILLGSVWKMAFTLMVIGALALYGLEMKAIVRARKRRTWDWALKYFLTALSLLIPLSALALVLCWPGLPATFLTTQLENVYGFLALIGVVTFGIMGMLYKIVPFLVWFARYSSLVGQVKVPALADLYSARLQALAYWPFLAGLLATSIAILLHHEQAVRWSFSLVALSVMIFLVNMGKILLHLRSGRARLLGAPQIGRAPFSLSPSDGERAGVRGSLMQ